MEWLKHLSDAIAYIEEHLTDEISIEEAAGIAGCSVYYFQRLFTFAAGISLGEYIRRRRMSQAALELQRSGRRVLDVALTYGYSSPTSFNRAFQAVHGIPPAAAKNKEAPLRLYPPIHFSVQITGGNAMTYHIARKEAFSITGIRIPLTPDPERNMRIIPAFWQKAFSQGRFGTICGLAERSGGNAGAGPEGILGVSVYEGPQNRFYYIAAAGSYPKEDGMFEYRIPAATWAVFENNGPFKEEVQTVFRRFSTEWLPFSGYEYAGLPDVEVYPACRERPALGFSQVWFALKDPHSPT